MPHDPSQQLAWLTRRDGTVVVGHGPMTAAAAPPADGVSFLVQDFDPAQPRSWWIPATHEILNQQQFADRFPHAPPIHCRWDPIDAAPFSEVFQQIMTSIHGGACEKTVPVVTESGTTDDAPGPAVVAHMAQITRPLQSYGFVRNGSGFAGATPELLLSLDGNHLRTMALAGTARSEDRDVFAVDEKEIREHEYVAQTLISKLLELGNLQRESRRILDLGPIVHFLTDIRVDLHRPASPLDLLQRLHPTPALGPLPRTDMTMQHLLGWRRQLGCPDGFGAPFGLWENGRFDAVVAIRGVWWDDRRIQIPAGCGIIEASRLVNEWRELRLKREAVKRFIQPLP